MSNIVDVTNDLTDAQKLALSDKLELLMAKYGKLGGREVSYHTGVLTGLNNAYKLINEINDDYNIE